MKRLVNSQLLCMLKKMDRTFNLGEYDIRSVYEDWGYIPFATMTTA